MVIVRSWYLVLAVVLWVPVVAQAQILFQDDFESGSISQWEPWSSRHPVLVVSSFDSRSGNYSIHSETDIGMLKKKINPVTLGSFPPNPSFEILVKSALKKYQKKQKVIFVDIRMHQKFKSFRIPGSLNIPLYALKSKNFLKQKSLILVNEGFEVLELKKECRRLKGTGFQDVKILKGGLHAWKENNGEVQGDVFAIKELDRVSPDLLFKEKNNENLLLINISDSGNAGNDPDLPEAVPIPLKIEETSQFCEKVKSAIHNHGTASSTVLIFNKAGDNYDLIDRLLKSTGIKSLFYLERGSQGYKKYLSMMTRMGQPKQLSTNRGNKCATCP